ncbi:hypothetical protein KY348_02240 [Candidatus Woesearchaeota archaeon]|nr:hypothetical protein [Candidatus Woesearchaeota archaeon]
MKKHDCCPKFNPKPWDDKTHKWKNKLFIMDTIPQLFHTPLPWMIGRMIHKQWKKAQDAGAAPKIKDFLWLAYDPSPWKSEHYIHVTKEVPGANNVKLSGTFITKVYDGPFNKVPVWIKDMEKYLAKKGKKPKKYYFYFTTCPKCAKKYRHNYVVAFAQV